MGFNGNSLDHVNKPDFPPRTTVTIIFHPTKYLLSVPLHKASSIIKGFMEHGRLSESINTLHFNDFKVFLIFSESLMKDKRFQMVLFSMGLS